MGVENPKHDVAHTLGVRRVSAKGPTGEACLSQDDEIRLADWWCCEVAKGGSGVIARDDLGNPAGICLFCQLVYLGDQLAEERREVFEGLAVEL